MPINRILTYLAAFVAALIVLLSGALVIAPRIEATRAAHAETDAVDAANAVSRAQLKVFETDFNDLDDLHEQLSELRAAIPVTADLPGLLRQLDADAAQHGVTLDSVSLGDPLPQTLAADTATDAASSATVEPVAAGSAADSAAANTAVVAEPFATLPLSLSVVGGYDGVLAFVNALQQGERLVSVTAFTTATGDAAGATVTSSISATVYLLDVPAS